MPRYYQGRQQQSVGVGYTPHYDPNFTQMLSNTLQQAQGRWDQASDAHAANISQLGSIETLSPDALKEQISKYEGDMMKVVEDYGGDWGAARNAISKRIGQEHANPFYNANRYHVEQSKLAQQLQAQYGADTLWLNDPRKADLQQAIKDGDLSSLEARAIQAPDYTKIALDLGKTIEKEMTSGELERYGGLQGYLVQRSTSGITEPRLEALVERWINPFITAASGIEHDYRDDVSRWLRDEEGNLSKEGIANFIMDTNAGLIHENTQNSFEWNRWDAEERRNRPEAPEAPQATDNRKVYTQDAEVTGIKKEIKEADKTVNAIADSENIMFKMDRVSEALLGEGVGGVMPHEEREKDPNTGEKRPYAFQQMTDKQRERWAKGEATIGDALTILGGNVATVGERVERGITGVGEAIGSQLEKEQIITRRKNQVAKLFIPGSEPDPGTEEYQRRGELLELLWNEKEDYNLKRDEEGIVTFDYPDRSGTRWGTSNAQRRIMEKAVRGVNTTLDKGFVGLQKDLKESFKQIDSYVKKHPIVEQYYNQLFEEYKSSGMETADASIQALTEAVGTMANTQRHRQSQHSSAIGLTSVAMKDGEADITTRKREQDWVYANLRRDLRFKTPETAVRVIHRKRGTKDSDLRAKDLAEILEEKNIDAANVVPIDGKMYVIFNSESDIFEIDLKEANFLQKPALEKITEVQKFIKDGINFENTSVSFGEEEQLGTRTYFYTTGVNEETGIFETKLVGVEQGEEGLIPLNWFRDSRGNPLNVEEEFQQDYVEFIFQALM